MKKSKYVTILLLSFMVIIPMTKFSTAVPPSYVGISEGDVYTWGGNLNKNGIISLKDDIVTAKDEIKTFLENPAGLETWLKGFIPPAWLSMNFTSFLDAYLVNLTDDIFNPDSIMTPGWTEDLLNDTIISVIENFTDVFTQGNMPTGFMDLNISSFLEALVDNLPNGFMPVGWESNLNFTGIIGVVLENISTTIGDLLVDRGILPFGMPDGWLYMTLIEIYEAFVDMLSEGLDPTASALIEMMIGGWQYSSMAFSGGLGPGNVSMVMPSYLYILSALTDSSLMETLNEMFLMLSPEFAAYNVSQLIANFTGTLTPEIANVSMSDLISNMTGAMFGNLTVPISIKQLINMSMLSGMAMGLPGYETDSSMDVLITQFVEFINNQTFAPGGPWEMVEAYITQIESAFSYMDLTNMWANTFGLRATIDSIGEEYMVTIPNSTETLLKGVPMNVSLEVSLDMLNWTDLRALMGMSGAPYAPITMAPQMGLDGNFYILDPTDMQAYSEYAAIPMQILLSFCLFISPLNNWDTTTTFAIPLNILPLIGINILQGFEDITFEIKWTEEGVLKHVNLSYGTELLAQASLQGDGEPMVPGFDVLIILGLSGIVILGLIYNIKKKKLNF